MIKFFIGTLVGFAAHFLYAGDQRIVEISDGSEILVRPAFKKYLDNKQKNGVTLPFIDVPDNYANNVELRVLDSLKEAHASSVL